MRRLRSRGRRIDQLRSEARPKRRGRMGKLVYLTLLLCLALVLFDVLAGDLVYLRGKGMVSRDVAIVSPEFSAVVLDVTVDAGDQVTTGQPLTHLRSQSTLKDIARLTSELAVVEARRSEMRIRQRKLEKLMPLAQDRAALATKQREQVSLLHTTGLATVGENTSAIEKAFDALSALEELEADAEFVDGELARLSQAVARAQETLDALEDAYAEGVLTSSVDGVVGSITVSPGEGVKEGQRLMDLFHGPYYVLAYVPAGALYEIEPDDKVVLRYGLRTVAGRVEERLPLAYRLPQEFQQAFQTVERQQLVRITLDVDEDPPPLFTEVEVTRSLSVRVAFVEAMDAADLAIDTVGLAFGFAWRWVVDTIAPDDAARGGSEAASEAGAVSAGAA